MFRPEALAAHLGHVGGVAPPRTGGTYGTLTAAVVFGLTLVLLAVFALVPSPEYVRGVGTVRVQGSQAVRAPAQGHVDELRVAPGDEVQAGQVLVVLEHPEVRRRHREVRERYDAAVRAALRSTSNPELWARSAELGRELDSLSRRLEEAAVRAQTSGRVVALRVRETDAVVSDQVLAVIAAPGREDLRIVALVPGNLRPKVVPGADLRLRFAEYPRQQVLTSVESVSDELVDAREAAVMTSEVVLNQVDPQQGHAVVTGRLTGDELQNADHAHRLYDGMTATVEVMVEDRTLLQRLMSLNWETK